MAVVTHGGCHYPVHVYPCVAGHETAQSMRRFDTSKLGLRKMKVLAILRAPEIPVIGLWPLSPRLVDDLMALL